jgi:hypothetical protein
MEGLSKRLAEAIDARRAATTADEFVTARARELTIKAEIEEGVQAVDTSWPVEEGQPDGRWGPKTDAALKKKKALAEASVRGTTTKLVKLKRLPDGTFAPKGRGQVLHPGMKVGVPTELSGPDGTNIGLDGKPDYGEIEGTIKSVGNVSSTGKAMKPDEIEIDVGRSMGPGIYPISPGSAKLKDEKPYQNQTTSERERSGGKTPYQNQTTAQRERSGGKKPSPKVAPGGPDSADKTTGERYKPTGKKVGKGKPPLKPATKKEKGPWEGPDLGHHSAKTPPGSPKTVDSDSPQSPGTGGTEHEGAASALYEMGKDDLAEKFQNGTATDKDIADAVDELQAMYYDDIETLDADPDAEVPEAAAAGIAAMDELKELRGQGDGNMLATAKKPAAPKSPGTGKNLFSEDDIAAALEKSVKNAKANPKGKGKTAKPKKAKPKPKPGHMPQGAKQKGKGELPTAKKDAELKAEGKEPFGLNKTDASPDGKFKAGDEVSATRKTGPLPGEEGFTKPGKYLGYNTDLKMHEVEIELDGQPAMAMFDDADVSAPGGADGANPQQAALDAYKAAGGNDPKVLSALGDSEYADWEFDEEGFAKVDPADAPEDTMPDPDGADPDGLADNSEGISIENMTPGTVFEQSGGAHAGEKFIYHKPTAGGDFHVVKPVDGGKATVFHGKQVPPKIGPLGGDSPTPGDSSRASAMPSADDTYEKLSKSVAAVKSKQMVNDMKGIDTSPTTTPKMMHLAGSPAKSPNGNYRNFKAMGVKKLTALVDELEAFGQDPEGLSLARAALAAKQ